MIRINKGAEPRAWQQYRLTPGVAYSPIPELREALLREQGYLCAYCMQRIPVAQPGEQETSKIEHWRSRANYPNLALDYNNLLICCPGNLNRQAHCDKLKASKELAFSPLDPNLEDGLSYSTKDGATKSANPAWQTAIETALNLNHAWLKANRLQVLNGLLASLAKQGSWPKAKIQQALQDWSNPDTQGYKKPYAGIILWFLRRKLEATP